MRTNIKEQRKEFILDSVKLIECFQTYQGEGPDSGKRMLLLRFKYCDQHCSFCDTKVKMRISKEGHHTIPELQVQLQQNRSGLMITGGEPTFKPHYDETVTLLKDLKYNVANVETNGYDLEKLLLEESLFNRPIKFIYSPKIFGSFDTEEAIKLTHSILSNPKVYIKIPYWEDEYVDHYCDWLTKEMDKRMLSEHCDFDNKVWLMPLGDTFEAQKENSGVVMDACEKYSFNFSGRTHIMYNFI